jgi:hypothetical protein
LSIELSRFYHGILAASCHVVGLDKRKGAEVHEYRDCKGWNSGDPTLLDVRQ